MASRSEMFAKLGLTKPVAEPILNEAYKREERQIYEEDLFSAPHGQHWHLSFHASSFPGDDPKACGRKAIYTLMNIPGKEPISRQGRAVMEAGQDIEARVVWRYYRSGLLLSDPPDAEHQMGYEDTEHWLTGSPDVILLIPNKNRPHVVEIKTKWDSVIDKMKAGQQSFDPAHRIQCLTYIGLTRDNAHLWPELEPCNSGSILYLSRDNPSKTHEFVFSYNEEFMKEGREKLEEWKQNYLNGELPERPKNWKWTEEPCKWCVYKRDVCKPDYKDGVTKLKDSNGIAWAEKQRKIGYDYEETRKAVLQRWNVNEEEK